MECLKSDDDDMERFEAEENELEHENDDNIYQNNPNVARFSLQYLGTFLQIIFCIFILILYKFIIN